ncbi:MAG: TetR/AcrR family transcriptional regulator [Burkholderiaceae bacterium]|nr:TetR/AcrR family transcriptional regulator [Burkholderiaceae bacterium]
MNPSSAGRPTDHSKDEDILEAAHHLLFTQGPAGFSVEAVARKAGVSKVTVYARHPSRDALIEAVVLRQAGRIAAGLSVVPENIAGVRDTLARFARDILLFLTSDEHRDFMRVIGGIPALQADTLNRIHSSGTDTTVQTLERWMRDAHRAGLAHFPDPAYSAELLLGMLMGMDLVRMMYGEAARYREDGVSDHANRIVDAFLMLHKAESVGHCQLESDS